MAVDVKKPLKKMLPHLLQAQADNLNEADTIIRLIKTFEEVLGYDAMSEISREAEMKGKFVDVILKVDGVVRLLVEAKAAGETLRDRHIDQAQGYASKNNYRWVLLTNGVVWNLYHLTFGEGIEYERAFSVDLSSEDGFEKAAHHIGLFHKMSIKKGELDDFWQHATALGASSIGKSLFQESVLSTIRREIRREEGRHRGSRRGHPRAVLPGGARADGARKNPEETRPAEEESGRRGGAGRGRRRHAR